MKIHQLALALTAIATSTAFAQSAADEFVQRNINQQQRVENGSKAAS